MDARLAETAAIKANFKLDMDKLDQLKEAGELDDDSYQQNKKALIMKEAEMIRELELNMEKSQKDEDATLRSELEKKHLNEQVEFRKAMAEQQASLRRSLIGDAKMVGEDTAADQKALEKYEAQKKLEEEKRLHNIKLKKKTVAGQLDAELSNKYGDYDDLLRRKREE